MSKPTLLERIQSKQAEEVLALLRGIQEQMPPDGNVTTSVQTINDAAMCIDNLIRVADGWKNAWQAKDEAVKDMHEALKALLVVASSPNIVLMEQGIDREKTCQLAAAALAKAKL